MWQFYWRWLKTAFRHSFDYASLVATVISLVVALGTYVANKFDTKMKILEQINEMGGWGYALAAAGVLVVCRLFLSPYWIYKEKKDEAAALQSRLTREAPYFLSPSQRVNVHKLINKFEISLGYINKGSRNALNVSASLWIRDMELAKPALVVNHKSANEVPPGTELKLGATFGRTALVIKPQFVALVVSYLKDRDQAVPSTDSFFYKWNGIQDEVMPIHVSHASMEQRKLIESDVMRDLERRGLLT